MKLITNTLQNKRNPNPPSNNFNQSYLLCPLRKVNFVSFCCLQAENLHQGSLNPRKAMPCYDLSNQKPFNLNKQSKTMPLRKGTRNIGANIEELMSKGRSFEQSKVIALKVAGKYKKLKK